MIRRSAKWSFRLGLLVAIAVVVKKIVDSKKPSPAPVVPTTFPRTAPAPPAARAKPGPGPLPTDVVEVATEPETEPEPAHTPAPEPEAAAATPPEPEADSAEPEPPAPPVKKAAATKRPRRAEPLKAKRAAKRAERPTRANRKVPVDASADGPRSAMVSWVEPVGTVCPTSHPIKAKLGSKVFRKPGMASYEASKPDRCYASEGAARRAGFTEAQR